MKRPARATAAFAFAILASVTSADEKVAPKTEKITLQYRVSKDAFAPSKFVAVIDKGITLPLQVSWDLPKTEDKDKKKALVKAKKDFDDLIKKLEDGGLNGVEFECEGEWVKKGFQLRITTVPTLTKRGKERIKGQPPC